jgi:hypothetical protein
VERARNEGRSDRVREAGAERGRRSLLVRVAGHGAACLDEPEADEPADDEEGTAGNVEGPYASPRPIVIR